MYIQRFDIPQVPGKDTLVENLIRANKTNNKKNNTYDFSLFFFYTSSTSYSSAYSYFIISFSIFFLISKMKQVLRIKIVWFHKGKRYLYYPCNVFWRSLYYTVFIFLLIYAMMKIRYWPKNKKNTKRFRVHIFLISFPLLLFKWEMDTRCCKYIVDDFLLLPL